jgi:hypothetical protein
VATGDQTDTLARTKAVLPGGWFPVTSAAALDNLIIGPNEPLIIGPGEPLIAASIAAPSASPILDAALAGPAWGWSWLYGLLAYVAAQHRIETATDSNLDLIGGDYFATGLLRRLGETDAGYRQRILANLLAPRGTRAAVITTLDRLTGTAPVIFEPGRPADTGAWGNIASGTLNTGLAYNTGPGGWGDLLLPAQFFVTVQRPIGGGIAYVSGWNSGVGGWGVGAIEYASLAQVANEVTDTDIYAAVNLSRPAGTTAWVAITAHTPPHEGYMPGAPQLGVNFVLGSSTLS